MKTRSLIFLAILAGIAFPGCAFMNDEDKEFYGKGWVHPTELDQVAPRHDPLATQNVPMTSSAAPTQQTSPEWIVPQTSDNNH